MTASVINVFAARAQKQIPRLSKEEMPKPWEAAAIVGRILNSLFINSGDICPSLLDACKQTSYDISNSVNECVSDWPYTPYEEAHSQQKAEIFLSNAEELFSGADWFLNEPRNRDLPYAKSARFTAFIGQLFLNAYKQGKKEENSGNVYNQFYANPLMALLVSSEVWFDIEESTKKKARAFGKGYDGFVKLNDAKLFRMTLRHALSQTEEKYILTQERQGEHFKSLQELSQKIAGLKNPFAHESQALFCLEAYLKPYKPATYETKAPVTVLSHFRVRGKPPQELQLPQAPYSPPPIFEI